MPNVTSDDPAYREICTKCGAKPRNHCRNTTTGRVYQKSGQLMMHRERIKQYWSNEAVEERA
jgi:hypothetical protein